MGWFLRQVGLLEESLEQFQVALHDAPLAQNPTWIAQAHNRMGNVYSICGDLNQAESMHQQALEINQQLGSKEGMANQYGNLGILHEQQNNLDSALADWQQALSLWKHLKHKAEIAKYEAWIVEAETKLQVPPES